MPVKTETNEWIVENVCTDVSVVRKEKSMYCTVKSENEFTKTEQLDYTVKPKILKTKLELLSLPIKPESLESKPEVPHCAPYSDGQESKPEMKPEPPRFADYSDDADQKPEDLEFTTYPGNSEITSGVGQGSTELRASPKIKAKIKQELLEADSTVLTLKPEQSHGLADTTENLVVKDQLQEARPPTSGQNTFSKIVTPQSKQIIIVDYLLLSQ